MRENDDRQLEGEAEEAVRRAEEAGVESGGGEEEGAGVAGSRLCIDRCLSCMCVVGCLFVSHLVKNGCLCPIWKPMGVCIPLGNQWVLIPFLAGRRSLESVTRKAVW